MESRRIASTRLGGLKVLGRAAERDPARLAAWLAAHPELGTDSAHLFAEPVPTRDGSRIDWYVAGNTQAVPIESLDPARQAPLRERVATLLAAMRREGERLRAAGDPEGELLANASQTPEPIERYLYVQPAAGPNGEDVPVLICWAHTDDAARTLGAAPQVMVATAPPPGQGAPAAAELVSVPAVPASRWRSSRWWWLLWLLLVALLLSIAWQLLLACGLTLPGPLAVRGFGWSYCSAGGPLLATEAERARVLEDVAQRLQLDLLKQRAACAAATPPPLPKDRWQGKDLSILAGCWTLGKDTQSLIVDENGKQQRCTVHAGTLCFKADGTGTREQTTDCGAQRFSVCKAAVTAHFNDAGALETTQPETKCTPAAITWHSEPNRLICKRTDDSGALCRDGDNFEHEFRPKAQP